jgi:hypothetical protein
VPQRWQHFQQEGLKLMVLSKKMMVAEGSVRQVLGQSLGQSHAMMAAQGSVRQVLGQSHGESHGRSLVESLHFL